MSWDMGENIKLTQPSTETAWLCKNMPQTRGRGLETKPHVYTMPVNGKKLSPTGGTQTFAKPSREGRFPTGCSLPEVLLSSYLQVCICPCRACLKEDILVLHPAFLGLHSICQDLLNGYFLDGGFFWIVWLAGMHR